MPIDEIIAGPGLAGGGTLGQVEVRLDASQNMTFAGNMARSVDPVPTANNTQIPNTRWVRALLAAPPGGDLNGGTW